MSKTINLGAVTAYADAVAAGYTGTREEFAQDLANAANYAAESHQSAETASDAAETATAAAAAASLDADAAHDDAATAHSDAEAALSFKAAAETAAGTATTKAGEAANSASQAATSASGAAGSATAASGSATAAAGSATNAATSETAAAGSATSAAGSASAAAQTLVDVNAAGATQVAAIAAKGEEVLESIPSDYTALSNDVDDLKSDLSNIIPYDVKIAMDNLFAKSAYSDNDALTDYLTFHTWATSIKIVSISAEYTQSGTVYADTDIEDLRNDLIVTASYDNGTTQVVTTYTLSGTLGIGISTVLVSYGGKTAEFTVVVTERQPVWVLGKGFNATTSNEHTVVAITTSSTRANFVMDHASIENFHEYTGKSPSTLINTGLYAIKIPEGATGVKITPPADVYLSVYSLFYDGTLPYYKWVRPNSSGWQNPNVEYVYTFDITATHWVISCKHGDAGTADVTQADVNGVTWEYVY